MKAATLAVLIGVTVEAVHASDDQKVTVCSPRGDSRLDELTLSGAQMVASRILAHAEIHLRWRGQRHCPAGALQVSFASDAPRNFHPGAMAYALPYEGTRIVIFEDRVQSVRSVRTDLLLGHVLAHEIGHMLQGVCRHSDSGLMKAAWGLDDYRSMASRPMRFSALDVLLITETLRGRSGMVAVNPPPQ